MSVTEAKGRFQPQTSNSPHGPKNGGNGGRRGGNLKDQRKVTDVSGSIPALEHASEAVTSAESVENSNEDVCWICAEPVKYYSVSACNHRTCHVCALRLRALYKKMDCTFCKEPQSLVIFSTSKDAPFATYDPESMVFKDAKLSVFFETQDMMEETLLLLRFNCPDSDCPHIGNGWGDLKLHVRAMHGKLMCDLCIRTKKVFAHEHALYPPNLLPVHLPSAYQRAARSVPKDQIEGGVHPLCAFCRECFFGDDELYAHMRERHEECFVCKRNGARDQHFQNYMSLENHFNQAHHPCTQPTCLARKFVVFNTVLDLKAHMVEEHGNEMSSRDRKDARRVVAEFEFEEIGIGGRAGRLDRNHRDREREPPPHHDHRARDREPPPQRGQHVDQTLVQAPPRPGRLREGFGAALTVDTPSSSAITNRTSTSRTPSPPADIDNDVAERHSLFISRLQSMAANPTNAVPVVKAAVRGYRASESSAKDLISTVWNVMDQNLDNTAGIVNALVDLLDQEDKKQDLLASWRGFTIEQRREFPDLVPANPNSAYAAIAAGSVAAGRVINAKHVTATRSRQGSSRQVWDRVAQAAASSSKNPASRPSAERLPATPSGSSQTFPVFRQSQRNTPWASRQTPPPMPAVSGATPIQSITVVREDPRGPRQTPTKNTQPPPKLSSALFPELPSSSAAKQKLSVSGNTSLKNILGSSGQPSTSAWSVGTSGEDGGDGQGDGQASGGPGKGKKGKGKQKQTLFTLGSSRLNQSG